MGQAARYELKYVIEEERARAVADYVQICLRPSPLNSYGPSSEQEEPLLL